MKSWRVLIWWTDIFRGHQSRVEAGGHFAYEDGDTVMSVIEQVAKDRGVDLHRAKGVQCELVET